MRLSLTAIFTFLSLTSTVKATTLPTALELCQTQLEEKSTWFLGEYAGEIARLMAKSASGQPVLMSAPRVQTSPSLNGALGVVVGGVARKDDGSEIWVETEELSMKVATHDGRLSYETLYCDYTYSTWVPAVDEAMILNSLLKTPNSTIKIQNILISTVTFLNEKPENFRQPFRWQTSKKTNSKH